MNGKLSLLLLCGGGLAVSGKRSKSIRSGYGASSTRSTNRTNMSEAKYPEAAPLDQDLLAVLKETCKSYKG